MSLLYILLGVVGPTEVILIIAVVLLIFGGKKVPELMKGIGSGMREFKKASEGAYDDDKEKPMVKEDNNPAEKK
jgi:sec-independent protein translocase protein TatA